MTPKNFAERLLTDNHEEGANLTHDELQQIYLQDYTGDLGLLKSTYVGKGASGDHRYLGLFQNDMAEGTEEEWYVTDIYVGLGKVGPEGSNRLSMDFGGSPIFTAKTRPEAEEWLAKESHMKGGGNVKPVPKPAPRRYPPNGDAPYVPPINQRLGRFRRGGGGDSPHWDGNKYAL
jgi:hypothetical protein